MDTGTTSQSGATPVAAPAPVHRIAEWVRAGIITQEQADRIAAHEGAHAQQVPRATGGHGALLAEALGYVGGVVILVAAILLATEFWTELGTAGRLVVVGAAAAALFTAGAAVPARAADQGRRLHAVLWAGATGAFAGFTVLLADDVLDLSGTDVALVTTAATAAVALVLWWRLPTVLQQLVALVALAALASATVARIVEADHLPGAGAWLVGVVWFLLASGGRLRPRRIARALGAGVAVVGALMTLPSDGGIALTLVTAVAVVTTAVAVTDLGLLAVGAVGLLFALPITVETWFGGALAAPVALLGAGLVLVLAALWIARRRHPTPVRTPVPPGPAEATSADTRRGS